MVFHNQQSVDLHVVYYSIWYLLLDDCWFLANNIVHEKHLCDLAWFLLFPGPWWSYRMEWVAILICIKNCSCWTAVFFIIPKLLVMVSFVKPGRLFTHWKLQPRVQHILLVSIFRTCGQGLALRMSHKVWLVFMLMNPCLSSHMQFFDSNYQLGTKKGSCGTVRNVLDEISVSSFGNIVISHSRMKLAEVLF